MCGACWTALLKKSDHTHALQEAGLGQMVSSVMVTRQGTQTTVSAVLNLGVPHVASVRSFSSIYSPFTAFLSFIPSFCS